MRFHEVPWDSMGFHEVPWNSMRFYIVLVNRSVPTEANRGLTSYRLTYTLRRYSSYKAGTISLHKGKDLGVKQDVLVCVIGHKILAMLLN
jgi:hypothetical protein